MWLSIFLLLPLEFFISDFCHFNYDMLWYRSLWVHLVWAFLWFLYLNICFLLQLQEFFSHSFTKYIFDHFLSSGTPIMQMLICLMLAQRSLNYSPFYCCCSYCCSDWVISIILSSKSLMCSSLSPGLLKSPSNVFFISVITIFNSDLVLFYIF